MICHPEALKLLKLPPEPMPLRDYARLYRREHRRRTVVEEKMRRISNVFQAGLPESMTLIAILLITRK